MDKQAAMATIVGSLAVIFWGFLALFTVLTEPLPPFQLLAMTFALAAIPAVIKWSLRRENPLVYLHQPWPVWGLSVGGLFGYHFLYFLALRQAPPLQASLIAYLWPLLIVLLSAKLAPKAERGKLSPAHVLGAVLGFGGAVLLLSRDSGLSISAADINDQSYFGYLLALACALVWALYSVFNRRFKQIPTDSVAGFCLLTSLLAAACHYVLETSIWPLTAKQWWGVVLLGIGPVGLAFYAWDFGVKHGHIRLLGILAYFAPLISTLALIAAGIAEYSHTVALACLAIVAGSLLAGYVKSA